MAFKTTTISNTSFSCSDIGSSINGYLLVTDNSNNMDSAIYTVTVMDTLKPMVITNNVIVYLDSMGTVNVLISDLNNGSNDNCGIASIAASDTTFSCGQVGNIDGYLVITDNNMNVDSAIYTVNVMDTIFPSFTSIMDTAICADAIDYAMPTVWDNCTAITPTQIGGPAMVSLQNAGDYYIVFEASDASGQHYY